MNDNMIGKSTIFKYLAVDKTSDGILEELRQQANKEYRISGYLNDVIWKNKLFYN